MTNCFVCGATECKCYTDAYALLIQERIKQDKQKFCESIKSMKFNEQGNLIHVVGVVKRSTEEL